VTDAVKSKGGCKLPELISVLIAFDSHLVLVASTVLTLN